MFQPIARTAPPTAQALPGFANFVRSNPLAKKSGPFASTTQPFLSAPSTFGLLALTQMSAFGLPVECSAVTWVAVTWSTCRFTVTVIP